jgi:hypothetical protein
MYLIIISYARITYYLYDIYTFIHTDTYIDESRCFQKRRLKKEYLHNKNMSICVCMCVYVCTIQAILSLFLLLLKYVYLARDRDRDREL